MKKLCLLVLMMFVFVVGCGNSSSTVTMAGSTSMESVAKAWAEAYTAVNDGATIEELYDWLMENRLKLCHWFTVDDLFYLKRGGRVSGAAAVMGTVLSIKPVMHVDDNGKLIPKSKVIGRKRAIETMVDKMKETAINSTEQTIYIAHGDCIEDAEYLAELVKKELNVKDIFIHYIEPVIGCHSGPGTLALFFMGTKR